MNTHRRRYLIYHINSTNSTTFTEWVNLCYLRTGADSTGAARKMPQLTSPPVLFCPCFKNQMLTITNTELQVKHFLQFRHFRTTKKAKIAAIRSIFAARISPKCVGGQDLVIMTFPITLYLSRKWEGNIFSIPHQLLISSIFRHAAPVLTAVKSAITLADQASYTAFQYFCTHTNNSPVDSGCMQGHSVLYTYRVTYIRKLTGYGWHYVPKSLWFIL